MNTHCSTAPASNIGPRLCCKWGEHTVARKSLAREHRAQSPCKHEPVIMKEVNFTSHNIQNHLAPYIECECKRLRECACETCLMRGGRAVVTLCESWDGC